MLDAVRELHGDACDLRDLGSKVKSAKGEVAAQVGLETTEHSNFAPGWDETAGSF